jgi:hypothetical protein
MTQDLNPDRNRAARAPKPNLAEAIRRRFAPFGGVEVELTPDEMADDTKYSSNDQTKTQPTKKPQS